MYVASIVLFLLTIDAQTVFNVASVKNASDKKFIEGFTSFLTLLDAKLGAEVEVGAPVSDTGILVSQLGPGSIIGSELSRYNRPGYRHARFPSQFTYVADGFVDFLVLPKSMIINVNNQVTLKLKLLTVGSSSNFHAGRQHQENGYIFVGTTAAMV